MLAYVQDAELLVERCPNRPWGSPTVRKHSSAWSLSAGSSGIRKFVQPAAIHRGLYYHGAGFCRGRVACG